MTDVKRLAVNDTTYNRRGWNWNGRAMYERFKPHMKLPAGVDRILTNADCTKLYAVGKTDGIRNTVYLGELRWGTLNIPDEFPGRAARYNCQKDLGNGFVVVAERVRARQVDPNKVARPAWRAPLGTVWEPPMLEGTWVMSRDQIKAVGCSKAPEWADRLWVSTSDGTDTFVWVDSKSVRPQGSYLAYKAQGANGITGHQTAHLYSPDTVLAHAGCHWQLVGVRKKTVRPSAPEVVKPSPDKPVTATEVREAQREMERVPTVGVSSLNDLIRAAPYGHDIYSQIAASLNTTRAEAKLRSFRDAYTRPQPSYKRVFDFEALERQMMAYCVRDVLDTPKPPIVVQPRNLHDEARANALGEAMVLYLNGDLPFPIEWATEWNELRARLNKEQK